MPAWHLYVVRARDGSLYTGITVDVDRRLAEHDGDGTRRARYLRGRGPLRLELRRKIGSRGLALRVEHRVKRLTKREKESLIETQPTTRSLLRLLSLEPDGA